MGEKLGGLVKDVYGAWALPAALLLPPVYVLVPTVMHYALTQWRVVETTLYRRWYSAAVVGLSYAVAGLIFRWIRFSALPSTPTSVMHGLAWCMRPDRRP